MMYMCIWIKARNQTVEAIAKSLRQIMLYYAKRKHQVFKTITGDIGSDVGGQETEGCTLYILIPLGKRPPTSATFVCCDVSFSKTGTFPTTVRTTSASLTTVSADSLGRFLTIAYPKLYSAASLSASASRDRSLGPAYS